jgi:DNA-binding LacI/PurR family transcriptional regulator
MSNVRAIAKRAKVSITTVSRVLNNHPHVSEEARQRVLSISNSMGYSQSVGRRSTSNVAFVYTGASSLGSAFDAALLEGLNQGLQEHYFDLMIVEAQRGKQSAESYSQMFLRKGICGAILRTTTQSRSICEDIISEGFPAVVVADRFENKKVSYIDCDARDACREGVEHLIGLGHREIAVCVHVVDDSDHADRIAAYKQALSDHGIAFDPRLVLRVPATREGGVHLLRRLATAPSRPSAIFVADPLPAVGILAEARKLGWSIPNDLSVLAFDDTDLRLTVAPELTAVCQDAVALGREAFSALRQLMQQPHSERKAIQKTLRGWLEIHHSTAAPPRE